ncbi:serine/arginine repetitive matrix protein 2-like [Mustela nigripes]|uniref:serine/arginine repetitive matrix protein 2-like n=1 Tax=Mustela nigripes TaxID=77151 RepID=UPI0028153337|nr:serine/arginine repetitive matrix protein 2-like [Mustela nigripes]
MHSSTQSWPILRTGRNPTVRERPGRESRGGEGRAASVNPGNWRPYISSSTRPPNTAWAARSTRQPTSPILCPGISLPKFSGLSAQDSSDAPPPVPRSFARSGPQNSPFRNPGTHPKDRRARAHPHTHTPTHARARVTSRRLRVSGNPPTRPPKSPLHSPEL